MSIVLRRLRAVALTASTWAIGWAIVGATFRVVWPYEIGGRSLSIGVLLESGLSWTLPGAISGTVYAILVMAVAPRRIEEMSVARMTLLGAAGGGLIPLISTVTWGLFSSPLVSLGWSVLQRHIVAGAICGAVSLLLARRGPTDGDQAALPREGFPETSHSTISSGRVAEPSSVQSLACGAAARHAA